MSLNIFVRYVQGEQSRPRRSDHSCASLRRSPRGDSHCIEACDPDVIDLGKLGGFGRWLRARCAQRLPGRRIISDTDDYSYDENVADWRSYDPTALVSIVLPVYNGEKYLSISIESCLAKTIKTLN